jgi:hypothetical protein
MAPRSRRVNLRDAVVRLTRAMVNEVREDIYTAMVTAVEQATLHRSTHVWRQLARERNWDQDHDRDQERDEDEDTDSDSDSDAKTDIFHGV